MKTVMLTAAAMMLAVALNPTSALAEAPRASNGYAISQTAESKSPGRSMSPHYEWQYSYDRHQQYQGHWVLVR